jgi:hypothetical protein
MFRVVRCVDEGGISHDRLRLCDDVVAVILFCMRVITREQRDGFL